MINSEDCIVVDYAVYFHAFLNENRSSVHAWTYGFKEFSLHLALYCILQVLNLRVLGCWVWPYMAEDFEDNRNQFQVSSTKSHISACQLIEGI